MSELPSRLIDLPPSHESAAGRLAETVLRPMGITYGPMAGALVEAGLGEWLAGGPCAFSAAELVEGAGEARERELRSVRQVALMRSPAVAGRLRLLTDPRQPVAGLTWVRPRILATIALVSERRAVGERSPKAAIQRGRLLAGAGADIVAVSAGEYAPDEAVERERVVPVVGELAADGIRVAVATRRAAVMRAAARAGARIVIDDAPRIDEEALYTLGDLNLPVILRRTGAVGAMRGGGSAAVDFAVAVHAALEARIEMFEGAGVPRSRLIIDPGTGPGRPPAETAALLHAAALFHGLGCVLLADCAGFAGGARRRGVTATDGADIAFAAMSQGVQIVGTDDPARAWAATSVFRALAFAQFDNE